MAKVAKHEWIKGRLKALKLTQAELAQALGLAQPQVNKLIHGTRNRLLPREIEIIAETLKMSVGDVAKHFVNARNTDLPPLRGIKVIGRVQAGIWSEGGEFYPEDQIIVDVPVKERWARHSKYALEVHGHSMDLVFVEGTVLVCVPTVEVGHDIENGTFVIVERRRQDLTEATVKEWHRDGKGTVWLRPKSSRPEHQDPIKLGGEEVQVTGLVIGAYREFG